MTDKEPPAHRTRLSGGWKLGVLIVALFLPIVICLVVLDYWNPKAHLVVTSATTVENDDGTLNLSVTGKLRIEGTKSVVWTYTGYRADGTLEFRGNPELIIEKPIDYFDSFAGGSKLVDTGRTVEVAAQQFDIGLADEAEFRLKIAIDQSFGARSRFAFWLVEQERIPIAVSGQIATWLRTSEIPKSETIVSDWMSIADFQQPTSEALDIFPGAIIIER